MIPVIVENPSSFTVSTGLIECICGNLIHPSMSECGDCMDADFFVSTRGQRVITHTRRTFKYGN